MLNKRIKGGSYPKTNAEIKKLQDNIERAEAQSDYEKASELTRELLDLQESTSETPDWVKEYEEHDHPLYPCSLEKLATLIQEGTIRSLGTKEGYFADVLELRFTYVGFKSGTVVGYLV